MSSQRHLGVLRTAVRNHSGVTLLGSLILGFVTLLPQGGGTLNYLGYSSVSSLAPLSSLSILLAALAIIAWSQKSPKVLYGSLVIICVLAAIGAYWYLTLGSPIDSIQAEVSITSYFSGYSSYYNATVTILQLNLKLDNPLNHESPGFTVEDPSILVNGQPRTFNEIECFNGTDIGPGYFLCSTSSPLILQPLQHVVLTIRAHIEKLDTDSALWLALQRNFTLSLNILLSVRADFHAPTPNMPGIGWMVRASRRVVTSTTYSL